MTNSNNPDPSPLRPATPEEMKQFERELAEEGDRLLHGKVNAGSADSNANEAAAPASGHFGETNDDGTPADGFPSGDFGDLGDEKLIAKYLQLCAPMLEAYYDRLESHNSRMVFAAIAGPVASMVLPPFLAGIKADQTAIPKARVLADIVGEITFGIVERILQARERHIIEQAKARRQQTP